MSGRCLFCVYSAIYICGSMCTCMCACARVLRLRTHMLCILLVESVKNVDMDMNVDGVKEDHVCNLFISLM